MDGRPVQLGAGTVLTAEQARQARDAGVSFLVTPALTPALEEAAELGSSGESVQEMAGARLAGIRNRRHT